MLLERRASEMFGKDHRATGKISNGTRRPVSSLSSAGLPHQGDHRAIVGWLLEKTKKMYRFHRKLHRTAGWLHKELHRKLHGQVGFTAGKDECLNH